MLVATDLTMEADGSTCSVIDVTNDNIRDVWPTLMQSIDRASFVAVDTEMSAWLEREHGPRMKTAARPLHSIRRLLLGYDLAGCAVLWGGSPHAGGQPGTAPRPHHSAQLASLRIEDLVTFVRHPCTTTVVRV